MSNFCFAVLHATVANIINLFIQPDAPQRFAKCGGGKVTLRFTHSAAAALL